ncbi:MAG: DUF349 domain-containing protein [Flavobacteriaceae bacterium]|nr:DUF349 domain-containing protein [Flavobacteriaceae bacterium]
MAKEELKILKEKNKIKTSQIESEIVIEKITSNIEGNLNNDFLNINYKEVESLIEEFNALFDEIFKNKQKEFIKKNKTKSTFEFKPEYKNKFDKLLNKFKKNKRNFFKNLDVKRKENLEKKIKIINEMKALIDINQDINLSYKIFKNLQKDWRNTGKVSKYESSNLWENYKHHTEKFYDYLHLNRNLRKMDFKHNYEQKVKIIEKTENLAKENIGKIFDSIRELNHLHRLWKNDLGPVEKVHREKLWKRFQSASNKIHDKKNKYLKNKEKIEINNLESKKNILNKIESLIQPKPTSHNQWQNVAKKKEELIKEFNSFGRTPKKENNLIWDNFRTNLKIVNTEKNKFYKNQKEDFNTTVLFKKNIIKEIKNILKDRDFEKNETKVKTLQKKWKIKSNLPRKISEKLWIEFQESCNSFFKEIREEKNKNNKSDKLLIDINNKFIQELKKEALPEKGSDLYDFMINKIDFTIKSINDASSKTKIKIKSELNDYFSNIWIKTKLSKEVLEVKRFETKLYIFKNDQMILNNEKKSLVKKIAETKSNLIQLQNNLEFFSDSSAVNPIVKDVNSKIKDLKITLEILKEKFKIIKENLKLNVK